MTRTRAGGKNNRNFYEHFVAISKVAVPYVRNAWPAECNFSSLPCVASYSPICPRHPTAPDLASNLRSFCGLKAET